MNSTTVTTAHSPLHVTLFLEDEGIFNVLYESKFNIYLSQEKHVFSKTTTGVGIWYLYISYYMSNQYHRVLSSKELMHSLVPGDSQALWDCPVSAI